MPVNCLYTYTEEKHGLKLYCIYQVWMVPGGMQCIWLVLLHRRIDRAYFSQLYWESGPHPLSPFPGPQRSQKTTSIDHLKIAGSATHTLPMWAPPIHLSLHSHHQPLLSHICYLLEEITGSYTLPHILPWENLASAPPRPMLALLTLFLHTSDQTVYHVIFNYWWSLAGLLQMGGG